MTTDTNHDPELARLEAVLLAAQVPAPIAFPDAVSLPLHVQDGMIRVIGHRIDLFDLVDMYNEGAPAAYIALRYDLPAGDVHIILGWYLNNKEVVDAYNAAWTEYAAHQERYWRYKNREQTERLKALRAERED